MIARFLLIFTLVFFVKAHAFYVGNGLDPNIIQQGFFTSPKSPVAIKFALVDDWIIGKDLTRVGGRPFKKFQRSSTGGSLTLDFFHRVNIESFFGSNSTNGIFYGLANQILYFKTQNCLSYFVGGKAIVLEYKNFSLNASGKFYRAWAKLGKITNDGTQFNTFGISKFITEEYQWGLQGAYTLNFLMPYAGWYYHRLNAEFLHLPAGFSSDPNIDVKNRYNNGIVIGCTISNHKYFSFNVEARFIAETAVATEVGIKF